MNRAELRNFIWQEVTRALNVSLTGVSFMADGQGNESIASMLPGVPTIPSRPVAFPYGYNAMTPDNVSQLLIQGGNSPLNRMVIGHFDANRPALATGEVILYNSFGQVVYLKNGKVLLGSMSASQPVVLGTILQQMLSTVLNAIANHTHSVSVPATPFTGDTDPPSNASTYSDAANSPVDDGKMLSKVVITE